MSDLCICSIDASNGYRNAGITHLITIANPGTVRTAPNWFTGEHLPLWFGDVVSDADAVQCRTKAVCNDDIRQAIIFYRAAQQAGDIKLLVSCDYGASRSPALVFVLLADQYGPGREQEAFNKILEIQPDAVPNGLVVRTGDLLLGRRGVLVEVLHRYYAKIDRALVQMDFSTAS